MTQEEIQIAQAAYCVGKMWDEYEGTDDFERMVGKRVRHLIELVRKTQPSLPSDLDEAAKQIVIQKHPCMEDCLILGDRLTRGELIALVKAGAEWMAGQGQTFEAHIDNGCAIASGVKLPFVLWDTYEDGDVLKVQIWKKQ